MPSTRMHCYDCPLNRLTLPHQESELDEIHLKTAALVSHYAGLREAPPVINPAHALMAQRCAQNILDNHCKMWELDDGKKSPGRSFIFRQNNK